MYLGASGIDAFGHGNYPASSSYNALMSSARQAVMRGPSLVGFGKRPSLIPAHQVDLLTGIGPCGARMEESRTKPVVGKELSTASE
jgi:hypothetical protein